MRRDMRSRKEGGAQHADGGRRFGGEGERAAVAEYLKRILKSPGKQAAEEKMVEKRSASPLSLTT